MTTERARGRGLLRRLTVLLLGFGRDPRANVAAIVALSLVPLLGMLGLAGEGSTWLLIHRAEQNGADSAVIAAANGYLSCTNGGGTGSTCGIAAGDEGQAVSKNYNFTNGANSVTVAVDGPNTGAGAATCPTTYTLPTGAPGCFKVTITKHQPIYLVSLVGYTGTGGAGTQTIVTDSIAGAVPTLGPVCILALKTGSGSGIQLNGNPNADLGYCTIFSDSQATCTGHNSGAIYGGAVGTDSNCGITTFSNAAYVADPYSATAQAHVPANQCTSYKQEVPAHGSTAAIPADVVLSGTYASATALANAIVAQAGGTVTTDSTGETYAQVCGDFQLSGNVTMTSGNLVLAIQNGQLDTNGYTLMTGGTAGVNAAGMTVVFQNQANGTASPTPYFTGGGNINLSSPTNLTPPTGQTTATDLNSWQGWTVYDPAATGAFTYAGNSPGWQLSGIVDFPNTDFTWSGAVGKANGGFQCFDLVVNTLLINGTAQMFDPLSFPSSGGYQNPLSQCSSQGVTPPEATFGYRYTLVG